MHAHDLLLLLPPPRRRRIHWDFPQTPRWHEYRSAPSRPRRWGHDGPPPRASPAVRSWQKESCFNVHWRLNRITCGEKVNPKVNPLPDSRPSAFRFDDKFQFPAPATSTGNGPAHPAFGSLTPDEPPAMCRFDLHLISLSPYFVYFVYFVYFSNF